MQGSQFSLLRRQLMIASLLMVGSTGLGLLVGSQAEKLEKSSSEIAPTDSQQGSPATTVIQETTTTSTTIPKADPGFIDTQNWEETSTAWKEINSRPQNKMIWTGNTNDCDAGTTSHEFKEDVLARVKWFRAMAGVDSNITLNSESSRLAQEAALVMKANNDLSHEPSESWNCFSNDAFEGASRSNLSLGDYGVVSIDGYIEDYGPDNFPVGHRRWIFNPGLTEIGTGDTNYSNALFVVNSNDRDSFTTREEDGFVMWPPRGFVPRATIFPRWSISHTTANFSNATVKIEFNGRIKVIDDPYSDSESIGNLHTLVFEWIRPSKGTGPVKITISNIEIDGIQRSFMYEVRPFG